MQSRVQTLSSKDHRKLWITTWSPRWSLVLFLVLLHFQPNISIMWIWWKFFTGSILPKHNVWIFFLICRKLCLSTLTFSPFILLLPLQYLFLHTLLLAIAQMSHMLPSAWKAIHVANLIHFLSLSIDFSWRVTLCSKSSLSSNTALGITSLWSHGILCLPQLQNCHVALRLPVFFPSPSW